MGWSTRYGILFLAGIAASLMAWRWDAARRSPWFRHGGLIAFALLLGFAVASRDVGGAFELIAVIIIAVIVGGAWMGFLAFYVVELVAAAARAAIGVDQLRVPPAYSLAEAAVARKDFAAAERLYRDLVAKHPQEPEPCRRLAELLLELKRPAEAMAMFALAERREPEAENRMIHRFSAAEILADNLKDPQAAIATLEEFLQQYPDVRHAEYVTERLKALRLRAGGTPSEPMP